MSTQPPSLLHRFSRSLAVSVALMGMVISVSLLETEVATQRVGLVGPGLLLCSIGLHGWAESIHERPWFALVPAVWLIYGLSIGIGDKGGGLLLGLFLLLGVSSGVRSYYARLAAGAEP